LNEPVAGPEGWEKGVDQKRAKVKQMGHLLKVKAKGHPNADGSMDEAAQKEYLKKYEAEIISPEEAAKWTCGASNAGYHYLGCAKTFALMGGPSPKPTSR
jgi:hypothetical protein